MRGGLARLLLAALLGAAGCAQDNAAGFGPPMTAPELEVRNLTQWAVWDVRLHPAPDYANFANRLVSTPLGPRRTQRFKLTPADGVSYVTVIRDKVQDGDRIAFTSAFPVNLQGYSYALEVLENEFRLRQLGMLAPPDAAVRDAPSFDARAPSFDARLLRDAFGGGARDAGARDASDGGPADGGTADGPGASPGADAVLRDAATTD